MTDSREGSGGKGRIGRIRILIIVAEATLILGILTAWLAFDQLRVNRSLLILFLYSFPSEFLIGLVPHEPVLLFYGEFHPAWTVALVAGVGTVLAEGMNYSFLSFFSDVGMFEKAREKTLVARVIELFGRAPFLAILVAGFTPVPFFPIRFLVVMERYSVARYLLGVFVSRTPRFFLLAALGHAVHFPAWVLASLFAVMILIIYLPVARGKGFRAS